MLSVSLSVFVRMLVSKPSEQENVYAAKVARLDTALHAALQSKRQCIRLARLWILPDKGKRTNN